MAGQGAGVSPSQTNEPPMTNGLGTQSQVILEPSSWSETREILLRDQEL